MENFGNSIQKVDEIKDVIHQSMLYLQQYPDLNNHPEPKLAAGLAGILPELQIDGSSNSSASRMAQQVRGDGATSSVAGQVRGDGAISTIADQLKDDNALAKALQKLRGDDALAKVLGKHIGDSGQSAISNIADQLKDERSKERQPVFQPKLDHVQEQREQTRALTAIGKNIAPKRVDEALPQGFDELSQLLGRPRPDQEVKPSSMSNWLTNRINEIQMRSKAPGMHESKHESSSFLQSLIRAK